MTRSLVVFVGACAITAWGLSLMGRKGAATAQASAGTGEFNQEGVEIPALETTVESTEMESAPGAVEEITEMAKNIGSGIAAFVFGTKYDALIINAANANNIPPWTLYRLLWTESHFREDIITGKVKSPVGALGIAQFMPATAREELGSVEAALDPSRAIPGAARYLAKLRASLGGDLAKAVAAYNWGIGNVKRKGLDAAPKETRDYLASVLTQQPEQA